MIFSKRKLISKKSGYSAFLQIPLMSEGTGDGWTLNSSHPALISVLSHITEPLEHLHLRLVEE